MSQKTSKPLELLDPNQIVIPKILPSSQLIPFLPEKAPIIAEYTQINNEIKKQTSTMFQEKLISEIQQTKLQKKERSKLPSQIFQKEVQMQSIKEIQEQQKKSKILSQGKGVGQKDKHE